MPPLKYHKLQPHPKIDARRGSEYFWKKVRKTFLLPDDYIHMNTGTTGSQPLFSINNLGVYNLYKSMDPRDWDDNLNERFPDLFPFADGLFGPSATTARQMAIADMYGANPDEIVLSYNTTDACNITFAGTPWESGDRIITTSWEHPAPSIHYDNRNWQPSTFIQFRGENNSPALYAMTDSASYRNYLGIQDIYDRGVALGNYLKDKVADMWGKNALWVQKNPDPAFATFLTSFNPFSGKDDSSKYGEMSAAISEVLTALAEGDHKIYTRSTSWRDQVSDTSDNRIGFRVSTHAVYNNYEEIDYMFDRLVAAVDATGLPQLG